MFFKKEAGRQQNKNISKKTKFAWIEDSKHIFVLPQNGPLVAVKKSTINLQRQKGD